MKTGFACGVFDMFHAGHVLMLKECKENCDHLIVGLNSCIEINYMINPGKAKPLYSVEQRKMILESCRYVDEVIIYNNEEELENILRTKNIDIRFLGDDYKGKSITAPDAVSAIYYIDRGHGMSTSMYRNKITDLNKQ